MDPGLLKIGGYHPYTYLSQRERGEEGSYV